MKDPFDELDVGRRRAVLTVAVMLAGVAVLALLRPTMLGTILVILSFFVMIMLHELGHFVLAKRSGMQARPWTSERRERGGRLMPDIFPYGRPECPGPA